MFFYLEIGAEHAIVDRMHDGWDVGAQNPARSKKFSQYEETEERVQPNAPMPMNLLGLGVLLGNEKHI